MEKNLASYAIWFNTRDGHKIERALEAIWQNILNNYELSSSTGQARDSFQPWLKVGDNFYLMHLESHWSPGDIGGFLRYHGHLSPMEDCMAVCISNDWYIPSHGFHDTEKWAVKIRIWEEGARQFCLVRR